MYETNGDVFTPLLIYGMPDFGTIDMHIVEFSDRAVIFTICRK